jgi:hypothetical protein
MRLLISLRTRGKIMPITNSELLKDKDVLNEISRYKWIESEKAGTDIGFERAAREWVNAYSKQYLMERPGKSAGLWIKSQPIYNILNKEIKF